MGVCRARHGVAVLRAGTLSTHLQAWNSLTVRIVAVEHLSAVHLHSDAGPRHACCPLLAAR